MERIISYEELPKSKGQSIYLRMESDPRLYISLLSKGYRIVNNITEANESTIYVTGRRQDYQCSSYGEYKKLIDSKIQDYLRTYDIVKPKTSSFRYLDLVNHKYKVPFVLKNENQNGGREKFLINTIEDYEHLISACEFLIYDKEILQGSSSLDKKRQIDYLRYLESNFTIQEYINTPTEYNTTVRLLTSSSNDLLYGALKYNETEEYKDDTTLLGYLLSEVFPLSTKSIVSNTLRGGENILLCENDYSSFERMMLNHHNINSEQFHELVSASQFVHEQFKSELGIICGFDYIYDQERKQWFLLEYHSRPMVGDYSRRQGIAYQTNEERLSAEGRVRATALSLELRKH